MVFGPHLMIDCYGCNKKKLGDISFITKFLDELPGIIGMHKIEAPHVVNYEGSKSINHFDKGGISGIVIITESHISIHTFVDQRFASLDIFSCKDFDAELLSSYIKKTLEAEEIEENFITRGKQFVK